MGTPLQAIKFAMTTPEARFFLEDWLKGDTEEWSNEEGVSYTDFCAANPDHAERAADDGSTRKAYYGSGEQPWDVMKRVGWAAAFAAGNVLKYLRRTKGEPEDMAKARWYWTELKKLCEDNTRMAVARGVFADLMRELKADDLAKLE